MKSKTLLFTSAVLVSALIGCTKSDNEDKGQPTVTITGKTMDRVLYPKQYVDPGATATDDKDGDLTSKIVAHNSIDYSNPNCTYDIYYSVKDAAGNEGSTGQRLVMLINLNQQFELHNGNLTYWDTPDFVIADSLKFKKFAGFTDAHISAFMPNDSTLTIPAQTVMCGEAPQKSRTFSGTGTLSYRRSGPGIVSTLDINYTQVENGTTTTGTIKNHY